MQRTYILGLLKWGEKEALFYKSKIDAPGNKNYRFLKHHAFQRNAVVNLITGSQLRSIFPQAAPQRINIKNSPPPKMLFSVAGFYQITAGNLFFHVPGNYPASYLCQKYSKK